MNFMFHLNQTRFEHAALMPPPPLVCTGFVYLENVISFLRVHQSLWTMWSCFMFLFGLVMRPAAQVEAELSPGARRATRPETLLCLSSSLWLITRLSSLIAATG